MISTFGRPHSYERRAGIVTSWTITASLVVVVAMSVGMSMAGGPVESRPSETSVWRSLQVQAGAWVEGYRDLESIARSADLVLLGRVGDVRPGRSVNVQGDVIHFAELLVSVDERLGGRRLDSGGQAITIEVLLPDGLRAADLTLDSRLKSRRSVFFLRNHGRFARSEDGERTAERFEYYYLMTPDSVLVESDDGSIFAPWSGGDEFPLKADVERQTNDFDDLVSRTRYHGGKSRVRVDLDRDGHPEPTVHELAAAGPGPKTSSR